MGSSNLNIVASFTTALYACKEVKKVKLRTYSDRWILQSHKLAKVKAHFVSSCQEARVVLKGLFHQSTEAVKQGQELLHIFLWVLSQRAGGVSD